MTTELQARFIREVLPPLRRCAACCFRRFDLEQREEYTQRACVIAWYGYQRNPLRRQYPVQWARRAALSAFGRDTDYANLIDGGERRYRSCSVDARVAKRKGLYQRWPASLLMGAACPRANPADIAAAKLDFQAWLSTLPPRHRAFVWIMVECGGACTANQAHAFIADWEAQRRLGFAVRYACQLRKRLQRSFAQFLGVDHAA